jgi:hypothetical protein
VVKTPTRSQYKIREPHGERPIRLSHRTPADCSAQQPHSFVQEKDSLQHPDATITRNQQQCNYLTSESTCRRAKSIITYTLVLPMTLIPLRVLLPSLSKFRNKCLAILTSCNNEFLSPMVPHNLYAAIKALDISFRNRAREIRILIKRREYFSTSHDHIGRTVSLCCLCCQLSAQTVCCYHSLNAVD